MIDRIISSSVIKNEAFWFPYGLSSIIDHVDHVLITDTGSTDGTKEIIKDYFISKYPKKITFIEKYPKNDDEFTCQFTNYKNEHVDISRQMNAKWHYILDGDEIYYNHFFPMFKNKLETLASRWRMISVNTRYFVDDLYYCFDYSNIWHSRFIDLRQLGKWVYGYGDIDWSDPKIPQEQRLTLELIPNQIDMMHMSLLKRSLHDDKATARIRRQALRRPGGKNVGEPSKHNFGFPEVFYDLELLELTQNPYVKDLISNKL